MQSTARDRLRVIGLRHRPATQQLQQRDESVLTGRERRDDLVRGGGVPAYLLYREVSRHTPKTEAVD